MWTFISQNNQTLNMLLNALMLVVWAFYLQLLFNENRRQKRPRILINRSAGHDLLANCVITNMSAEPIYLEAVVLTLRPGGGTNVCSLTDLETLAKEPDSDPRTVWFQGPLSSGEYLTLGSFRNLLREANGWSPGSGEDACDISWVKAFEMTVIATYGPDNAPVGTRRTFRREVNDAGIETWRAEQTIQIRRWWQRRRLRSYMRESG